VESLRWILLAAGLAFVLVIYLLGRSRRQRKQSIIEELEGDLPEFSAQSLDDVDEGVGAVRIVGGADVDDELDILISSENDTVEGETSDRSAVADEASGKTANEPEMPSDIIVLYILAKPEELLAGSQINSSVQAMGLRFGEMNIFHYRPDNRKVFSLANMMEPGSFDEHTIHDLKTSGLTVFMQIQSGDPLDDLTEMLQRSYQLAGLLDAVLCNHKRKPLTEQDAENYRKQVSEFTDANTANKEPELFSET